MDHLQLTIESGIALLTLNRPKALNALNSELLTELNTCLSELGHHEAVKVIILTGAGEKAFAAGADLSELALATPVEGRAIGQLAQETFGMLEKLPQVTIAAVNGFALGGGCELAMACDIRVAADNAKFGQPECGLGLLPGFGGTQRLPRLIGRGRAKELIFTCDMITSHEACQMGLVNHVVPQAELMDYCRTMAARIMRNSPLAIALAKQAIDTGLNTDLASGLALEANLFGLSFSTEDKREGITAFLEKRRDKHFTGR